MTAAPLPIDAVLPDLVAALAAHRRAVLQAPPGAGKTTRVPLALLDAVPGRIVMLEPRRLAVRGAAARMAETLGEPVGRTVGYAMRGERKVSDATRIEVVTEGLLARRLRADPELPGVSALVFDEFHERSLDADLALGLALEVGALRDDLHLLVMSATLDAAPVAELMGGAPVVTSEGRTYPVDVRYREAPAKGAPWGAIADLALAALAAEGGSALVFLPGMREIERVGTALKGRLPADVALHRLHGRIPWPEQRAAVAPAREGRKIVLSTAIAETSLTIEGVRIVVDAGLARRARFDPGTGMGRLVTEPASRAEADQRAGRAGRTEPGVCYRDWTRGAHGARPAHAPPEIATADLAGLALALADWGGMPPFLDPPDAARLEAARDLLRDLGALAHGRLTDHGRALADLPLHPRLGHMLLRAGKGAADLAALVSEGRGGPLDVEAALREWGRPEHAQARREAARLRRLAPAGEATSPGAMLSLEVAGFDAADALLRALRLITPAVSLGSTDTLIQHPAGLTQRVASGDDAGAITPGLLRLSVGLEDAEDLWADLERGLAA